MASDQTSDQVFQLRSSQFFLAEALDQQLKEENFVDVTLVCLDNLRFQDATLVKAHKMILASSSEFFQLVLKQNPCQHPVVILPQGITHDTLEIILEFIYRGEVSIPESKFPSVIQAANYLKIHGLRQDDTDVANCNSSEAGQSTDEPPPNSHSLKRKSSPKYHFKNKRKPVQPRKFGSEFKGSLGGIELPMEVKLESTEDEEEGEEEEEEKPMDFTIRPLQGRKNDEPTDQQESNLGTSPYFNLEAFKASLRSDPDTDNDLETPLSTEQFEESPSPPEPKAYTKKDLNEALESLKSKRMSLSRASEVYAIPATTLWQRANRMGIATPKRETNSKIWKNEDLTNALDALRKKEISANKASKIYGIPSSTLYKIARKEGIELAQPFNAVQTSWSQDDLRKALNAIRKGMPVQKASSEFGIPSGTLYGRCKKVGIELSKAAAVHWSEEDMVQALNSVQNGTLSINQAAIHHNLPYSSLYGRINRLRKENPSQWQGFTPDLTFEAFMAAGHHSEASLLSLTHAAVPDRGLGRGSSMISVPDASWRL
ncbi:hypothetical protein TCAL_07012 [Tigriopus californicus]|uniref:BTB domain-containing protein n=1 Tax=Tigriopus californicus TaxID=6832 RepID=A0A553PBI9_TIGCA|nr:uncharacterized protein LOC131876829 [Tigriopus californicus]XP_059078314.1 uncharacterized protein LOC131876829 [Tigriopus californicus]XP_059078315.1 uncharacterized protein LOC131876829 [Tigriopus californicus]XP_059078316.1 uncharacterized protein LOC131876829 [Tigriopus californicus]TRY75042.1 hypothetical protein TCAL_07012 [Tigriopus californicus]|eukprot:TCALIF_07012-PA protein Name:"Similar to bab1 Protein bric-a-brac 1 (Drosophila melanogaster)" AED:0.04 eAED:0.04 QI:291/1/1/1/0.66/0.75/4/394/542